MTTCDGVEPDPTLRLHRTDPVADLSIRELVGELAMAEATMRERPGAPEPAARLRVLVVELRRRRARLRRLQLRMMMTDGSPATTKKDRAWPPVRRPDRAGGALS